MALADSWSYASAKGSNANAFETLAVYAECEAASMALGRSYAIINGTTNVNIQKKFSGTSGCTDLDVNMALRTATLTISLAATQADASASATDFALAYTNANQACQNDPTVRNSIFCQGAKTGSVQLATAGASAITSGFTGTVGGSRTNTMIDVDATGNNIFKVKACLASFAQSFSFSSSGLSSLVTAYTRVFNNNFARACTNAYQNQCALNAGQKFCAVDPATACSRAAGYGRASAAARAFATALSTATASVNIGVVLHATVTSTGALQLQDTTYGEAVVQSFCGVN